ncbi:NADH-quinone oxidoreductase subunit NuoN [Geobacillus stearothermophilus]|uniref:NADH-quinone oxidoreductase subunit NuoN n=1 Tax=Geobacillus stearothermophilus TaxID=1422 RepID=UPI002E215DC7|nr:NADH-quinone oxidoreductase subunit NuoN [Geobacillus stearothermophilus]MED4356062.1 NADH-quinone oxidoreductase subunit NuoN [Geobacillus stearothermophilus]
MNDVWQANWGMMAPEWVILAAAVVLLLIDLAMPSERSRRPLAWGAAAAAVIALAATAAMIPADPVSILHDTFRLDGFAKAFKLILLAGGALALLLVVDWEPKEGGRYRGEFAYMMLFALFGAMMVASSGDLLTLFVSIELLTVSSYILAGLRKTATASNEAALKYVINGGIATAIMLFGMSYVFGLTGTTNLGDIARRLQETNEPYVLGFAFLLLLIGVSFKLATVPFHMWAPDVYEGAPVPATAFFSVVSKAAGFILLLRLFVTMFAAAPAAGRDPSSLLLSMQPVIAVLAGLTMIVGNVVALRQRSLKRLLAYSSIAHAGYLLAGVAAMSWVMIDSLWIYLLAYVFMNIGAFAIVAHIAHQTGSDDFDGLSGLYRHRPLLAAALGLFLLSLAGIPGTAGFIAKLYLFIGLVVTEPGHYVLAAVMAVTTVISYVYYFNLLVQLFFRPASLAPLGRLPAGLSAAVVVCALGTLVIGWMPGLAYDVLAQFGHFGDFLP